MLLAGFFYLKLFVIFHVIVSSTVNLVLLQHLFLALCCQIENRILLAEYLFFILGSCLNPLVNVKRCKSNVMVNSFT